MATAAAIPELQSRVNDSAGMLSAATVQQLETVLATLEREESTQIAVLIIDSLEGAVLEEYSLQVAEKWRLGQAGRDNGALLLIAKNDRQLRIEVGYGLEGSLTDLTAGRIINQVITPRFREGNFDQGVVDGVNAMIAAVRGEFTANDSPSQGGGENNIGGLVVFLIAILFQVGRVLGRRPLVAGGVGAALTPMVAILTGAGWLVVLALIPFGFLLGWLAGQLLKGLPATSGRSRSSSRRSSFGGFGSGGGGFSGGGGGFGGGGSSGRW